jgi:hypothetical protein
MIGLPCLVSQCAKFHVAGWTWAVFTNVYLESCTWPVAILTMTTDHKQQQFLMKYKMAAIPHPPYSPDLAPCDFFLFPKWNWSWKDEGLISLKRSRLNRRECLTLYRKGLAGSDPKMEETVGPVSRCGMELLRGWWRPYGDASLMIFTAPVLSILDNNSCAVVRSTVIESAVLLLPDCTEA